MINLRDFNPNFYARPSLPALASTSTEAGRRTLVVPAKTAAALASADFYTAIAVSLDLSVAASWDTTSGTDYTVADNRAGKDFYLYATTSGLKLSANSTVPTGFDASTSRKIGGFHCLCLSVGAISGHSLTGFLTGDILPASIWDVQWKPACSPEGMVYSAEAGVWVDIYLQSGTSATTRSAYLATTTDERNYWDHQDDLATVGKRMLSDAEFQQIALGSPEQVNIAGGADPVTTGGHRSTSGATNGTSTSAASPSTDISAAADPQKLTVALCGTAPVEVSINPTGLNTGALIAAALQTAIRAAIPWAGGLTVTYGTTYVISCPGSFGVSASVVITAGSSNDCTAALKLGVANGGVEVAGNLGMRIISNIGCEDCTGTWFQWVDGGYIYRNHETTYNGAWSWKATGKSRGQQYTQGADGAVGLLAGGSWTSDSSRGSRSRTASSVRSAATSSIGARGCARCQA